MRVQMQCGTVLFFLMCLASPARAQNAGEGCLVEYQLENRHRRVYAGADITAECPNAIQRITGINLLGHTPPFGNWGVETANIRKIDRDQFRGWHQDDDHRQWNSCTSDTDFDEHYNFDYRHGRMTAQKADPDNVEEVGVWSMHLQGTCTDRTVLVQNMYMEIYELDPGLGDDQRVATLHYPESIEIKMSCQVSTPGDGPTCYGQSDWFWPVSVEPASSRVDAQVRVTVRAKR